MSPVFPGGFFTGKATIKPSRNWETGAQLSEAGLNHQDSPPWEGIRAKLNMCPSGHLKGRDV